MRYKIENIRTHKIVRDGCTEEEAMAFLHVSRHTLVDKAMNGETVRQWYKVTAIGSPAEDDYVGTNTFTREYADGFTKRWNAMKRLFGKPVKVKCKNCIYNLYDRYHDEHICACMASPFYGTETDDEDECEEGETE